MQVVFYGSARRTGTSANMAAVSAGLTHYLRYPVSLKSFHDHETIPKKTVFLTDCSRKMRTEKMIKLSDLLVLNLAIPYQELEYVCYRHSFVQKNIIFLFGKYHTNQSEELKKMMRQYRIDPMRICTIPYNLRFEKAYKDQKVLTYLKGDGKGAKSYEDFIFERHLKHTVKTIITYANRKGENIYG